MADPTPPAGDVGPSRRYVEALRAGRLIHQRCEQCSAVVFPPRVLCPVCSGAELAWQPSRGTGTVYSASTLSPRDEAPYTVVLVDLDEGFRVMSAVAGPTAPIGSRVQLTPQPAEDPAGEPRLVAVLVGASDE